MKLTLEQPAQALIECWAAEMKRPAPNIGRPLRHDDL